MHLHELDRIVGVIVPKTKYRPAPPTVQSRIESVCAPFVLHNDVYRRVSSTMLSEMEQGLGRDSNSNAIVKMFPTYVRSVPNGSESGDFLALDLGGTNFRVLLIRLSGSKVEMENKIFPISEEIMQGHGTQLFDHIADCIEDFMTSHNLLDKKLPLGFTFSFPCKQEGLSVGRLVTWTKGFKCEGVEGEDVVRLLHEAIQRKKNLNVQCVAVLNDTVGCLMSCAFSDHDTEIGVILGTGTNACYMEKLDRVGTWDGDEQGPQQVIINTEWGAFGDNGCIDFLRTDIDKDIDSTSLNSGKQLYEKMISGMYMGEIVRRLLVECTQQGLLFGGNVTNELGESGKFYTKYISEIEADDNEEEGFPKVKLVLDELGLESVSTEECKHVRYVCRVVSERAAYLASAGIATLLNRINKPKVTVAVDGSLYRYHPHFHNLMDKKITELLNPGIKNGVRPTHQRPANTGVYHSLCQFFGAIRGALNALSRPKFKILLAEDGSGRGAALLAAVGTRVSSCMGS